MFITDDKEIELLLTRQEGQLEGLQKGLQEGDIKARREIAMNLVELGLSADAIAKASGLSELEIIALRDGPRTN
ncbi:MAG: hypothetical protein LBR53_02725 [Deltaproteobacteria bacterium]|jgi:predicted transposase YdaD|nr:hypothetical protein [Deltaproteobacteria bacterium]